MKVQEWLDGMGRRRAKGGKQELKGLQWEVQRLIRRVWWGEEREEGIRKGKGGNGKLV